MDNHFFVLEDDVADSVRLAVELFVWTAEKHLAEQLPHKLVSLFEALIAATLGTGVLHLHFAAAAQRLVTLLAILWLSHEVEAHGTGQ